jgi:phage minor structural protein
MIKIYKPSEKDFRTNGLGTITPLSCIETKKISTQGWQIEVSVDVKCDNLIQEDYIVVANTKEKGAQAFRIQSPTIQDKKITFTAEHILFDAKNYILADVRPENQTPVGYMRWCNDRCDQDTPFNITGNATGTGTNYFIRKTLFDAMQQAEETFGAVWDCDNYNLKIMASVGADRGFKVAYGKNIQGMKISQNWDEVVTKILPVGTNGLLLPEMYLEADVKYERPYTKVIEFDVDEQDEDGNDIDETTRIEQLRTLAKEYLEENKYPLIEYEVKSDVPQELSIGDTVHIKHPCVDIPAEVQAYTYDCNSGRVKTITFGNYDNSNSNYFQKTIDSAISAAVGDSIKQTKAELTKYDKAMQKLGEEVRAASGLYETETKADDGSMIIYLHDKEDLTDSKIIWRIAAEVMAVSSDGGETWNAGIDASGDAVMNYLTAHGIDADVVQVDNLVVGENVAMGDKAQISWQNVTDQPSIPSSTSNLENDSGFITSETATQITKDTITTSYVNALKVTAGSVAAENITGTTITGKTISGGTIKGTTATFTGATYIEDGAAGLTIRYGADNSIKSVNLAPKGIGFSDAESKWMKYIWCLTANRLEIGNNYDSSSNSVSNYIRFIDPTNSGESTKENEIIVNTALLLLIASDKIQAQSYTEFTKDVYVAGTMKGQYLRTRGFGNGLDAVYQEKFKVLFYSRVFTASQHAGYGLYPIDTSDQLYYYFGGTCNSNNTAVFCCNGDNDADGGGFYGGIYIPTKSTWYAPINNNNGLQCRCNIMIVRWGD